MTDEIPVKPTIRRRRIIARPRLIAALEKSRARVRMLVASAGYGKTILAEQWAAEDGCQGGLGEGAEVVRRRGRARP